MVSYFREENIKQVLMSWNITEARIFFSYVSKAMWIEIEKFCSLRGCEKLGRCQLAHIHRLEWLGPPSPSKGRSASTETKKVIQGRNIRDNVQHKDWRNPIYVLCHFLHPRPHCSCPGMGVLQGIFLWLRGLRYLISYIWKAFSSSL